MARTKGSKTRTKATTKKLRTKLKNAIALTKTYRL